MTQPSLTERLDFKEMSQMAEKKVAVPIAINPVTISRPPGRFTQMTDKTVACLLVPVWSVFAN